MHRRDAASFLAGRGGAASTPAHSRLAAQASHQQLLKAHGSTLSATWQAIGPMQIASSAFGNVTGRVTSIAIDASDATGNTVYIGTTGGGVWKSTNAAGAVNGVAFTPLTDTLPIFSGNAGTAAVASLSIGAVSVQPGGTHVVLAGTGDPNDALDSYYGSGLLRSADGGLTWTLVQNSHDGAAGNHSFIGEGFAGFAWSTASPNLVVAAVSHAAESAVTNATVNAASVAGLYYSNDAGVTWQMATISDGTQAVQKPAYNFAAYDGNAVTAVVWNPQRQRFYAAVRYHGYYQSSDGISWTRLMNQPGAGLTAANCPVRAGLIGNASCPIFRGALAVNKTTGDTFAFSVDENNLDQGIWQDACALAGTSCASSTLSFQQLASAPLQAGNGSTVIAQGDYNLTLAAVPVGSGSASDTLLFAGTADIFKCTLAAGCSFRNTTNTNNGCTVPAHVAPATHAVDFLALPAGGTQPLLYFGNDGGLWRSSDGVNQSGAACSADDASHFQNLNSALGSLTEVVHFSSAPDDANTLIVGAGTAGTAATVAWPTQSAWPQLSKGEGGYNAIDAANPLNWYIATAAGVSVNLCDRGSACTAADFATPAAVGPPQVSTDAALIDAPFLLDAGLQSNLIVGTCRIWRGPGAGGLLWSTSNLLSPMLDGITSPECNVSNGYIRSLAAGGTVNAGSSAVHAGSEVLYAGMAGAVDGGGSLAGGHLYATTAANITTGTTAWADISRSPVTNDPLNNISTGHAQFNPGYFDISSVVVDTHDVTGSTVYATVMGFSGNGVSEPHVYRSTDTGAHWVNISSNLPNAPANSLAVDPNDANTVYVAMDTGVYATTAVTTCATSTVNCWSVFGTGLPNAPVVQLSTTSSGMLRAGTYGRGIWQTPLLTVTPVSTAAIQLSSTALTFPAQQAGTRSAIQTVTVTNSGSAALTLSSIAVSGDFTESDNCTSAPIAVGASCAVQVAFLPAASGPRTGTLTFFGNVAGGQASATLNGTGLAPASIVLSPLPIVSFADTLVGATSSAMDLSLSNIGGVSAALQTPVVTGDFTITTTTCGDSLAAGASCGIALVFTPSTAGIRSGDFSITDDAGTQTVALSGKGLAPATDTLSPATLTFAAQQLGTASAIQQVTLTNTGDTALTLIAATIASGDFSVVNGCGNSLIAHGSCVLSVSYVPRSVGMGTGLLTVTDVAHAQTVTLNGTGVAPPGVSLTPVSPLDFGNVGVGQAATQTITLTNNGGLPLAITNATLMGDFSIVTGSNTCPMGGPATLAVSASCSMKVSFQPIAGGRRNGTLTLVDNAATSPQTLVLFGTAIDFAWSAVGSTSQTVSSGGAAMYALRLTPAPGLSGTVAFACSGAPANATCVVSPASADLGAASTNVQVSVVTGVAVGSASTPKSHSPLWWVFCVLPACLMRRRRLGSLSLSVALILVCLSGCGAGRKVPDSANTGSPGTPVTTPAGIYTLTVTATNPPANSEPDQSSLIRTIPLTLAVH